MLHPEQQQQQPPPHPTLSFAPSNNMFRTSPAAAASSQLHHQQQPQQQHQQHHQMQQQQFHQPQLHLYPPPNQQQPRHRPSTTTPPPGNGDVIITDPGPHDVIMGRGGGTNNHIGNRNFRHLIAQYKSAYAAASKNDKPSVAKQVVKIWRMDHGRFLDCVNKDTNEWKEVGDPRAHRKASQCLREKSDDNEEVPAAPTEPVTNPSISIPPPQQQQQSTTPATRNGQTHSISASATPTTHGNYSASEAPRGSPNTTATYLQQHGLSQEQQHQQQLLYQQQQTQQQSQQQPISSLDMIIPEPTPISQMTPNSTSSLSLLQQQQLLLHKRRQQLMQQQQQPMAFSASSNGQQQQTFGANTVQQSFHGGVQFQGQQQQHQPDSTVSNGVQFHSQQQQPMPEQQQSSSTSGVSFIHQGQQQQQGVVSFSNNRKPAPSENSAAAAMPRSVLRPSTTTSPMPNASATAATHQLPSLPPERKARVASEEYRLQLERFVDGLNTTIGDDDASDLSSNEGDWQQQLERTVNLRRRQQLQRSQSDSSLMSARTTKSSATLGSNSSMLLFQDSLGDFSVSSYNMDATSITSGASRRRSHSRSHSSTSLSLMSDMSDLSEHIDKLGLDDEDDDLGGI